MPKINHFYRLRIERTAMNNRDNNRRTPKEFLDTEIGLQAALASMDDSDCKIGLLEIVGMDQQLSTLKRKMEKAGVPYDTVKTVEDCKAALTYVYSTELILTAQ